MSIVTNLRKLLTQFQYEFYECDGSMLIALPNDFGYLEVRDVDLGEASISLVGHAWHTQSHLLGSEAPDADVRILEFLYRIRSGEYLLIEEVEPGKEPRRTIELSREVYEKWLPPGATYTVFNPAQQE